ncbi:Oidioi.mRNA.OKI2018_I69.chr2.g4953.t1.cds [Oikopleura dioica]|uniref:Oidioi.mRNA.OKI2018_I69.chr2.g4953.t1.cds n=1 Tax=Oikopleura dioica TaxID=34765 RepID=A0ABN7SZC7_OIKDI|nr:Oidioi.mRNA.OKI2018_I69.chr2.g4953.t1.cds [Oikopleura dioica]
MSRNGGSASSVDRIIRFRNDENQWNNAGQMLRKIAGHKSFASYPQSTGVDSFGYFNIFTIGGEGGNDIPMQRCDEYGYCYKVETETFDNRVGASIMLFNANEFNLNYLPLYEDHCP